MPIGIKAEPTVITCETCGAEALWTGGRRKRYCTPRCRPSRAKKTRQAPRPPEYHRAQAKKRRDEHQAAQRAERLRRSRCHDCGMACTEDTMPCFAWDHRNPTEKAFTISYEIGRKPLHLIMAEIEKCDLVCHNCHALRTHHGKHWANKRD